MGLPRLRSCCFIFDLKTGNVIVGCINAALSLIMTIVMITLSVYEGSVNAQMDELPLDVEQRAELTGIYAMSVILVLMFLAKFLFDCAFVYGVLNERPSIIRAYFFMWIVFTLLSMFTFFLNSLNYGAATICAEVFYIGLNVYVILLSHSYYMELSTRDDV